jgi:hypothetical protein
VVASFPTLLPARMMPDVTYPGAFTQVEAHGGKLRGILRARTTAVRYIKQQASNIKNHSFEGCAASQGTDMMRVLQKVDGEGGQSSLLQKGAHGAEAHSSRRSVAL